MNNNVGHPETLILLRRRRKDDTDIDITPMIDVVFLLLIFFLVCSTMGKNSTVELPKAKYGVAVNPATATVLTMSGEANSSIVFLGDGTDGRQLSQDSETQRDAIVQAVENGMKQGRTNVVVRADRRLQHGEVARIESIAASVSGITLYVVVDDL